MSRRLWRSSNSHQKQPTPLGTYLQSIFTLIYKLEEFALACFRILIDSVINNLLLIILCRIPLRGRVSLFLFQTFTSTGISGPFMLLFVINITNLPSLFTGWYHLVWFSCGLLFCFALCLYSRHVLPPLHLPAYRNSEINNV